MKETDFVSLKFAASFAAHVSHRFIIPSKRRLMTSVPASKHCKSRDVSSLSLLIGSLKDCDNLAPQVDEVQIGRVADQFRLFATSSPGQYRCVMLRTVFNHFQKKFFGTVALFVRHSIFGNSDTCDKFLAVLMTLFERNLHS